MDGIYWTRGARNRVWARYRELLSASPVPLQELHVPTRHGETCVFTCGPERAPPLVLLHGGNVNSAMWLRNLPEWFRRFRVYAIDSIGDPGFSATTRPPLDTDDHALWLEDVFRGLDLECTHVIGASFGGWIALDFATRRPRAVRGLVLLAPAGLARIPLAVTIKWVVLMFMGAWGRRRALMQGFGLGENQVTDDQRPFLAFCGVAQLNARSRIRLPGLIPEGQLGKLEARTLVILGGKDVFFDAQVVRQRLFENCPAAKVQIIPEAGHGSFDATMLAQEFLT